MDTPRRHSCYTYLVWATSLQPIAQPARPTGMKFDPMTGEPIPKFDPNTGAQKRIFDRYLLHIHAKMR